MEPTSKIYDISQEERRSDIIKFADISVAATELAKIHTEITREKSITRPIAASIESIAEGTLGPRYPVNSFSVRPSATNLTVAQEAIVDTIKDLMKRLFEMLSALYRRVVEVITNLYNRITQRRAKIDAERRADVATRKANTLMLGKVTPEIKKEIVEEARKFENITSDTLANNYNDLLDAFVTRTSTATAHAELIKLYNPYLQHVVVRAERYLSIASDLVRLQAGQDGSSLSQALLTLESETFSQGQRFMQVATKIPLPSDSVIDQSFESYVTGYRGHLEQLKQSKKAKAPRYTAFAKAGLGDLYMDDAVAFSQLLKQIESVAKRMDNVKSLSSDIDRGLVKTFTRVGRKIRQEAYASVDMAGIAAEITGIMLIAIRLSHSKAAAMYGVISRRVDADTAKAAKAIKDNP